MDPKTRLLRFGAAANLPAAQLPSALDQVGSTAIVTHARKWDRSEVAQLLISKTALTELKLEHALQIAQLLTPQHVAANSILIEEHVTSTGYMALVLEGQAMVANSIEGTDKSVFLCELGRGALFGELSVVDGKPRSATITALTDMNIAVLDRVGLARLIETFPDLACALLTAIMVRVADRLRATNSHVQELVLENMKLRELHKI